MSDDHPGRAPRPSSLLRHVHRANRHTSALALPFLLLASACGGPAVQEEETPTPAVEAVQARAGALPLMETVSGVVRARNQVAIRPEISAPIVEVMVQTGDTVTEGQPLVRLDREALEDQVRQAEANLRLTRGSAAEVEARVGEAQAQVVRTRALHEAELVSDLELETQEAQLEVVKAQANQAQARVEQAEATLAQRRNAANKAVLRAPVNGRVGQRNAEVGMLAEPGATLFMIGDFTDLLVEVPLTEGMIGYIEPGQRTEISSKAWATTQDGPAEPIEAPISRISPFLSQGSFSTIGEIDIGDGRGLLQPGMFATVRIYYGETETATLVPNSAIWDDPSTGIEGIWVVSDMPDRPSEAAGTDLSEETYRTTLQPVTVLARGRSISGVQGIVEGTWVVTVGQQLLSEEQSVQRSAANASPDSKADPVLARVRPTEWERVVELQSLQREDLLLGFLEKQRRLARVLGASIPSSQESADEALRSDEAQEDEAQKPEEPIDPVANSAAGGGV